MRGLWGKTALGLAVVLATGCGDDDDAGGDDDVGTVDAATPDAAEVAGACPAAAPAGDTGALVVFLNYDGATITPGMEDPATNTSSIVPEESTLPPAFADDAQRDTIITRSEEGVRALFGPFDIGVVTERPTSGDYVMIVIGGDPEDIGLSAGVGSIVSSSCESRTSFIGFVFEGTRDPEGIASGVAFLLGAGVGAPLDQDSRSCMCNTCSFTELCELPDEIIASQAGCDGGDANNPALTWKTNFGCRP